MDRKRLNLDLYSGIYFIRRCEILIRENYKDNGMKTPMHMSMGQEAPVVGVCRALGSDAQVVGTYRSHALFLEKTGNAGQFFSEMYGKVSGTAKGKSGSMHLSAPESGLLCVSAVVAQTIPVGVGMAFANKMKNDDRMVAAFFGDGAMDAGVAWESINFACLKRLPILFICEDNDFAVNVRSKQRQGYKSLINVVAGFDAIALEADTTDVEEIYNLANDVLANMKNENRPGFISLRCYRYLEHVGVNEDFHLGHRSRDEFLEWQKRDPIIIQRQKLLSLGINEEEIAQVEKKIDAQASEGIESAKKAEFPTKDELYKGVFYGE
jgi:TPP-dependent pyruvate/acetoin dehydrogenase alpha subunit